MSEKSDKIKIKQVEHVVLWTREQDAPDIVLNTPSEIRRFLHDCTRHGWPVWVVGTTAIVFAAGEWDA